MKSIPPLGMVESKTLLNKVRRPTKTINIFFRYGNLLTLLDHDCVQIQPTFLHVAGSNGFSLFLLPDSGSHVRETSRAIDFFVDNNISLHTYCYGSEKKKREKKKKKNIHCYFLVDI